MRLRCCLLLLLFAAAALLLLAATGRAPSECNNNNNTIMVLHGASALYSSIIPLAGVRPPEIDNMYLVCMYVTCTASAVFYVPFHKASYPEGVQTSAMRAIYESSPEDGVETPALYAVSRGLLARGRRKPCFTPIYEAF